MIQDVLGSSHTRKAIASAAWGGCLAVSVLFYAKSHGALFDAFSNVHLVWLCYAILAFCIWLRGKRARMLVTLAGIGMALLLATENAYGPIRGITVVMNILCQRYPASNVDLIILAVFLSVTEIIGVGVYGMLALGVWNAAIAGLGRTCTLCYAAVCWLYAVLYTVFCQADAPMVIEGVLAGMPAVVGTYFTLAAFDAYEREQARKRPSKLEVYGNGGGASPLCAPSSLGQESAMAPDAMAPEAV